MIHRLNIFLLSLLICFSPVYLMSKAFAATPKWVLEYIKVEKQVAEKKRLQAMLVKQINEAGSLTKTTAVVETVPTASKVGTSMLQRIKHVAKTPGGAAIGVYAVGQLLEGIGWVMEEGTYVKKIENVKEVPLDGAYWFVQHEKTTSLISKDDACSKYVSAYSNYKNPRAKDYYYTHSTGKFFYCEYDVYQESQRLRTEEVQGQLVGPTTVSETEQDIVPITAAMLGAAMLGAGYKDPDPNFNNDSVNTGNWTGVPEAYTQDPSGVGNELYKALEDKAERAPRTSDGKPAPSGDPRYRNDLTSNDNANDRSWDDQGTKGEGGSEKDDEGNEKSWFNLPKWCVWAADNCEWHQEDKAHQAEEKEVWQDEKNHRDQEKGFWQTVKDWFDWSKDDSDLPDRDDSDLDTSVEFEEKKVSLNVSAQCPAPTYETVSLHGVTAQVKTSDYSYICNLDWLIKPFVLGFSMVSACFILFGFQRGGDD